MFSFAVVGKETTRGPLGLGAEGISGGCCALVLAQCSNLLFTYTPSLLFGTMLTIKSVLKSKGEVQHQQSAHRGASQGLLLAWEIIQGLQEQPTKVLETKLPFKP